MSEGFTPNGDLSLEVIPTPDAPIEEIRRFADTFNAGPGTPRYVRGCEPSDWDDSPKTLTRLRSVLYAGFHSLAWYDHVEVNVRQTVRRIRDKVAAGEWE